MDTHYFCGTKINFDFLRGIDLILRVMTDTGSHSGGIKSLTEFAEFGEKCVADPYVCFACMLTVYVVNVCPELVKIQRK